MFCTYTPPPFVCLSLSLSQAIFNGNGYEEANQEQLTKAGVWCINSSIDAMRR